MVRLVVNRIPPLCPLNYADSLCRRFGPERGISRLNLASEHIWRKYHWTGWELLGIIQLTRIKADSQEQPGAQEAGREGKVPGVARRSPSSPGVCQRRDLQRIRVLRPARPDPGTLRDAQAPPHRRAERHRGRPRLRSEPAVLLSAGHYLPYGGGLWLAPEKARPQEAPQVLRGGRGTCREAPGG